jgi:hypothetical protein
VICVAVAQLVVPEDPPEDEPWPPPEPDAELVEQVGSASAVFRLSWAVVTAFSSEVSWSSSTACCWELGPSWALARLS